MWIFIISYLVKCCVFPMARLWVISCLHPSYKILTLYSCRGHHMKTWVLPCRLPWIRAVLSRPCHNQFLICCLALFIKYLFPLWLLQYCKQICIIIGDLRIFILQVLLTAENIISYYWCVYSHFAAKICFVDCFLNNITHKIKIFIYKEKFYAYPINTYYLRFAYSPFCEFWN